MIFRDDECFGLLEIYRSVLLSKGVFKAGKIRTTDNVSETQKDIYHLALLKLNLGAINRQPLIGGTKKFPSWIRKDTSCVVLPHLIFKNGAHIVAWCEASDAHGGIAIHQDLARDNAMLGMVVNAEITAPSLAIFLQGTHEVGSFIELLCQHQRETENKKQKNKFWILHGCIFRLAFGRVTSGEMVDPSSGIWTALPTSITPNMEASVKPHPAPLATTQADEEINISEIDGRCDVESCLLLKPTTGADNHDVHSLHCVPYLILCMVQRIHRALRTLGSVPRRLHLAPSRLSARRRKSVRSAKL